MPSSYFAHCVDCPYMDGRHLPEETRTIRCQPLSLEDNNSEVLLLFQAPGVEEWKSGKPISSASAKSAGSKLRAAFHSIGKARVDYNISNVVQCFPGKRAPKENDKPRDKSPPRTVCDSCSKWLQEDISKGRYKRIVVFGKCAEKAVKRLGYENDLRFVFFPHPTASGVSIVELAEILVGPD